MISTILPEPLLFPEKDASLQIEVPPLQSCTEGGGGGGHTAQLIEALHPVLIPEPSESKLKVKQPPDPDVIVWPFKVVPE